jgi:hypothetical protein
MKKMIQQRSVKIACCLITCFFISCNEPGTGEKIYLSAGDSISKTIQDAGFAVNATSESSIAGTLLNTATETIYTLAEVHKRLNKRASYFVIKNNRDTIIKCKEGTLLSIPADAFLNSAGRSPVAGEVRITVREFYKISDMMTEGLTTVSNGQLLETGGMINIKVTSKENNDSCILKPGKNIAIALANSDTTSVDGMQLFNGVHDSTQTNWVPRAGLAGLAQAWRSGRYNFSRNPYPLSPEFVFPDEVLKAKPPLIHSEPEHLQAEIKVSLRELMPRVGVVTKKANSYIDTSGNLHCYKFGNNPQEIVFNEVYSPTIHQNIKVNLAVDVYLSYKSNLNHDYYQKLFKMGKCNPDSLVTLTATLNPTVKIISFEKIKPVYNYALTVKGYQKKEKRRASLIQEYEKKLKQLRLDSERNATTNVQSAQNYLLLSTPKLGWINCDRFYNNPDKVDYFVELKEQASLLIVFNSIKSIISPDKNGMFQGVPLNEKITLVGLKTENGKLMMALHETTITKQPFEGLNFQPVTLKEYKSRLEKLNRL